MSENYIVINGKKAELTEEQLEKLGIKTDNNNSEKRFKRGHKGDTYYSVVSTGDITLETENETAVDKWHYKVANYCNDKNLMEQRAFHETLNRLLWRFACENGELKNEWDNINEHWYVYYNNQDRNFDIDHNSYCHVGCIYFSTKEVAKRAIEEVIKPFMKEHKDFVW